ncbi:hypothetical protein FSP39_021010 [Pinctada imbricata]|uniref:Large ribosomal subunit protein mL42 n=1 Tax=Pinctada imbricata TaxID=66713 RepID=A0AA88YP94_PINIB|nr:hypothetical protein FSP39_021010 [Pinctada imbricata]
MNMRQTKRSENKKNKEETSKQPRLCRHTIQRIANSPIHSQSDGTENEPNRTPMVAMTPDDSTIVCWHPEPTFPYEYTKPLPTRKDKDLGMGDSVLKVEHHRDYMERYRTRGPSKKELAAMFYTSKHQWFPK